jgi:hypothetical protein
MPLKSRLLKDDPKLQACLVSDPAHVVPGARGEHVDLIQQALTILGAGVINPTEIASMTYGPTTARTVLNFKGPPRNIINRAYQSQPDNIVGRMTIAALDREMFEFENRPSPAPVSLFVSTTVDGSPHDHSKCPGYSSYGLTGWVFSRVHHLGTPINPQGFKRKINLGGEGETAYLGFEDFLPSPFPMGPARPLTSSLPDECASDICLRYAPISKDGSREKGKQEILRIATPSCRLTFCGDINEFGATLLSMGTRIERVVMPDPVLGGTEEAWVLVLK